MKVYSKLDTIPSGRSDESVTPGMLVLEGGAFRALWTQGLLDVFMQENLNFSNVVGVSAGAMSGLCYMCREIGAAARVNLGYRHDKDYIGLGAMKHDHGITGFSYLFNELFPDTPEKRQELADPRRKFTAVATNVETGRAEYFTYGKCSDITKAVAASATVPYVSEPVMIDGAGYLDGGVAAKIPLEWALNEGQKKIIIVRTRDKAYRKNDAPVKRVIELEYGRRFPKVADLLMQEAPRYNRTLDRIDRLEKEGKVFVIAPSLPITISRFEGDMEALGDLYWRGYNDAKAALPALKEYLSR